MTLVQELLAKTSYGKKELARQDLIVSVTEQIWEVLEASEMSKADLARALETSKSHVTQLLDGTRNMTLSTLADVGEALGAKPRIFFDRQIITNHDETGFASNATASSMPKTLPKQVINYDYGNQGKPGKPTVIPAPGVGKSAALTPGNRFVLMAN